MPEQFLLVVVLLQIILLDNDSRNLQKKAQPSLITPSFALEFVLFSNLSSQELKQYFLLRLNLEKAQFVAKHIQFLIVILFDHGL